MSICFTFIPGEAACEVAVDMQTDNKSQLIRNALTGLFAVTVLALNLAALTRLEHTEELEEVYQAFGRMPFVLFLAVGLGRSALSFIHRKADRAAALNHLLFGAAALIGAANLYVRGNNPSSFQFTGTVYLAAVIISRIFAFRRAHSKKAVAFLILQILLLLVCMILPFIFAVFFIDMQALFSIGVGPGCVLIYGSHIAKRDDVTVSLTSVCLLDTSIATIAGMAMIPACIAMGLNPEAGSGLIFIILPTLFSQLPLGSVIGFLVFAAIFFAAITSAIAQLEIPVATFMHGFGWTRAKATAIIGIITLICAIISAISTGFLDFWSNFSGNYGFIVTAGIGSIVYGWVYGVDKIRTNTLNAVGDVPLGKWYTNWVKYIAIPILIIIMANSLFPFLG